LILLAAVDAHADATDAGLMGLLSCAPDGALAGTEIVE
jgi:hypothetical protein